MNARQSVLLVMAKMAMANEEISPTEREFLEGLLAPGDSLETLLSQAKAQSLPELLEPVQSYPDKFFIALRAASIGHADGIFDVQEEALYERLVKLLDITPADQELIQRSVAALEDEEAGEADDRIQELYKQSSFT